MKRLRVQLDQRTASLVKATVPARQRSKFIRQAIARALIEHTDVGTRAAYLRSPAAPTPFDPTAWADSREALRAPRRRRS